MMIKSKYTGDISTRLRSRVRTSVDKVPVTSQIRSKQSSYTEQLINDIPDEELDVK